MKTVLALCLLVGVAHAESSGKEAAAELVRASLPATMSLRSIELPRGWTHDHGTMSVDGLVPSRPGKSWVRMSRAHGTEHGYALVELAAVGPALELVHAIKMGESVPVDAVRLVARPLDVEPVLVDARQLSGRHAIHDMAAGDAVHATDLVAVPPVTRGSAIRVIVARGGVRVVAEAVLERDAIPGDLASARVGETRFLVSGRLVDRNTLVNEGGL